MRESQEAKLSVEKSRIQKLQVQQQNLEETYKLKVILHKGLGTGIHSRTSLITNLKVLVIVKCSLF